MTFKQNYLQILDSIKKHAEKSGRNANEIQLVAVTKNRSFEEIRALHEMGQNDFGENRVQELLKKIEKKDFKHFNWHFIGKLQTNKISKILGNFVLIHSIDSFELAKRLSDLSRQSGLVSRILLQVNTSGEASKQGETIENWREKIPPLMELENLKVEGLMTMAPLTEQETVIRGTFRKLRQFKEELQASYPSIQELSMGMSHDYPIAIQEGATLLRIGSAIFSNPL